MASCQFMPEVNYYLMATDYLWRLVVFDTVAQLYYYCIVRNKLEIDSFVAM